MRHHPRVVAVALAAMLVAGVALAQKKNKEDLGTRNVQGIVVDPDDKPVSQAVVQLKDMRTLQIRSYITQADGTYHFSSLKQDIDYQLKAEYQNLASGSKTLSVFDDRKTAVINLKLEKK